MRPGYIVDGRTSKFRLPPNLWDHHLYWDWHWDRDLDNLWIVPHVSHYDNEYDECDPKQSGFRFVLHLL